ncbi:unnamed protein product, partial [marine sediment metagenome]
MIFSFQYQSIRSSCLCLTLIGSLLVGCEQQEPKAEPQKPKPSVALRLLIVNDPSLAEAISRLRVEWAEQAGSRFQVVQATWDKINAGDRLDADLIIYPTRYLGTLCERDWLRPIRNHVLEDPSYNASDLFRLVRERLMTYGGRVMALPLGIDAAGFTNGWQGLPYQGAYQLLARAAPDVVDPRLETVLFEAETMRPRIAEPPFVRALVELCQG